MVLNHYIKIRLFVTTATNRVSSYPQIHSNVYHRSFATFRTGLPILNSGECKEDQSYLLFHDNLHSQTTSDFKAALKSNGVKGYSHALLAGNTDGLQPVDGGVGALLKAEQEEVFDEWLENADNWKEWTSTRMKASRKRAVLTQLYGVAWERVCRAFPFPKVSVR